MITDSATIQLGATANLNGTGEPNRLRLAAEERETVLIWNDADRTWSVYSDSARKGRVAKWLRALGIEPTRSPGTWIEAEGIPEWAVSFRTRRRRRRPGSEPLARNPSRHPRTPIQRHPVRVQGAKGREPLRTDRDPHDPRTETGLDAQTGLPGICLEGIQP